MLICDTFYQQVKSIFTLSREPHQASSS